jgi:hypothetical protein
MPHPCPSDPKTLQAGVQKRFCAKPPKAVPGIYSELNAFVLNWCQKNLKPLDPTTDLSFETWIQRTPYPEWRKQELRVKYSKIVNIYDGDGKYFKVKSFMKDEGYMEYKHARAINSRTDEFKCLMGPIFHQIEEIIFSDPHFIKHIPVKDRARFIKDRLYRVGAKYYPTDYSSFEALFIAELMENCEFVMYKYMTQFLPCYDEFCAILHEVLAGENLCVFKFFDVTVEATRMSGEMNTSLGNGFSNLMFTLFLCEKHGIKGVDLVAEGDDGLAVSDQGFPTAEQFAELGLIIKITPVNDLCKASFCGLIFDLDDEVIITDPIRALLNLGWTSGSYSRSTTKILTLLARAKALSMAYQYSGCPILQEAAHYIIRVTKPFDFAAYFARRSGGLDRFRKRILMEAINYGHVRKEVTMSTRLLMESEFQVTVEHQIQIETWFKQQLRLNPIDVPVLRFYFNFDCVDYYEKYQMKINVNDLFYQYPALQWPQTVAYKLR